jgi:hypothetical protein
MDPAAIASGENQTILMQELEKLKKELRQSKKLHEHEIQI